MTAGESTRREGCWGCSRGGLGPRLSVLVQPAFEPLRRLAGRPRERLAPILAGDKGYDCNWLRDSLRELSIRPLIKHCVHAPYDHAHNARIDEELYAQRSMTETGFSSLKRSLGCAVRARAWYREFREIALMCLVYNIKRLVTP